MPLPAMIRFTPQYKTLSAATLADLSKFMRDFGGDWRKHHKGERTSDCAL
jgi:hypothetical protein